MKLKNYCFMAVAGLTLFLLAGCSRSSPPAVTESAAPSRKLEYYTCSMHPQIHADKPGNCPICGMTLTPVYSQPATEGAKASGAAPSGKDEVFLTGDAVAQAGVQVEPAQKRPLSREILVYGTLGVNQNRSRTVVPLVAGRIDRQAIDFNQTEVRRGDDLVVLYSPEALTLQEDYLKALRERWLSTFYERKVLSSMIATAREKLARIGFADADFERLEKDRKVRAEVVVRAPVGGSIVANRVRVGEWVKAEDSLYQIAPLDELWFDAQVFEPDIGTLKPGQVIRITTKAFPGESFDGKLAFIGRSLDPVNRTIPVRFIVANAKRRLLPNLSGEGRWEVSVGSALTVPNSAVLDLGTRRLVYVQKQKGAYVPRAVRTGQVADHYTQILEGLEEGEAVVTAGAFLIDAQAQLRGGAGGTAAAASSPER
jgi:Cu(I)/Ag(I) efflux system membrane fusion protein